MKARKFYKQLAIFGAAALLGITLTAGSSQGGLSQYEKGKCVEEKNVVHPQCPILL